MLANRSELRSVNNSCFHEASTALGAGDEGAAGEDSRSYLPVSGRTAGSSIVADLNPVLRGWAEYFRNGNSGRKFNAVDGYVHEWLAIFASRKHGLAGRNWAVGSGSTA